LLGGRGGGATLASGFGAALRAPTLSLSVGRVEPGFSGEFELSITNI
jgi:hypothetical protein